MFLIGTGEELRVLDMEAPNPGLRIDELGEGLDITEDDQPGRSATLVPGDESESRVTDSLICHVPIFFRPFLPPGLYLRRLNGSGSRWGGWSQTWRDTHVWPLGIAASNPARAQRAI